MNWYIGAFKKYAVFSGRARRKEYWMFYLFHIIVSGGLGFLDGLLQLNGDGPYGPIYSIYALAVLVPSIALTVRRMHDSGHSGWWSIVPIVSFVFAVTPGTAGPNKYGPDPKAMGSPAVAGGLGPSVAANPGVWTSAADPVAPVAPVPPVPPVQPVQPSAPAGWYGDPAGRHQYRYWDGAQWTPSVSNNGVVSVETA